jgi:membrane protein YdbS with pleckstrin-like domain
MTPESSSYYSKIGYVFFLPLLIGAFGISAFLFNDTHAWVGILILMFVAVLLLYMFLSIRYTIDNSHLKIKGGFYYDKTIPIQKIRSIRETNNPLSAPAASMDRLEIKYNKYDTVLISPKEKQNFIDELLSVNPEIEVKVRKK